MIRVVEPVTENEMIVAFLRAEFDSPRYAATIRKLLAADGVPEVLIGRPDTSDAQANAYRRSVLARYRGFGQDVALFHGFPNDVAWYRAEASIDDLHAIRYINYEYWNELSGGSRLAADAARQIRLSENVDNTFRSIIASVLGGKTLAELILVGRRDWSGLVVLEGHTRLTAYLLEPEIVPPMLPVLVGGSDHIHEWRLY